MDHLVAISLSFIAGTAYYENMSRSIPKESSCSFSSNIWTDIGAFVVGAWLLGLGVFKYNDSVLTFLGTTIITEHIWQLVHNKL
jgi:hypothetical protein